MIALLIAALLAPAGASPSTPAEDMAAKSGSRVPKPATRGRFEDREQSAQVLQSFAKCLIRTKQAQMAAIVDPPYGTADAERMRRFNAIGTAKSFCLGEVGGGRMTSPHYLMVGAFAEQLYRRNFVGLPTLGKVEIPPIVHPDQVPIRTTFRFADCLIDRDPAGVNRLVRSEAGSEDEVVKFDTLAPHYGACLDAGSKLALNRQTLRAALAEHLYRRALAGRNGPAAASANSGHEQ